MKQSYIKKQFSLEEYLENPTLPIVTRNGRSVRIICTDAISPDGPIIALIKGKDGNEKMNCFYENGRWSTCMEHNDDLFFRIKK